MSKRYTNEYILMDKAFQVYSFGRDKDQMNVTLNLTEMSLCAAYDCTAVVKLIPRTSYTLPKNERIRKS